MAWQIDVLDDAPMDPDLHEVRLRVDGVEVEIDEEGGSFDKSGLGHVLTVRLWDIDDLDLFTPTALVDFGLGKRTGVSTWDEASMIWFMIGGSPQGDMRSWTGTDLEPDDRATITILSSHNEKLNRTSETGLILHDPLRRQIAPTDVITLYDKQQNAYTPEIVPIPNMKLGDAFDELLVTRCGFPGWKSDLPYDKYPIEWIQIEMGEAFVTALNPFIGMFSIDEQNAVAMPIIDDKICIFDSTKEWPEGAPAPLEITFDYIIDQLTVSRDRQKTDAIMMHYSGLENNYDIAIPMFRDPKTERPAGSNTVVETRIIELEFRKILNRATGAYQVVATWVNIIEKTTAINGTTVEKSSEQFILNPSIGKTASRAKLIQARMPNLPSGVGYSLYDETEEAENYTYQLNPFNWKEQFLARKECTITGLIAVDTDNPRIDGEPAFQNAKINYRNNNMISGMAYRYGIKGTKTEKGEPLRDGTVRFTEFSSDEVTPSVAYDDTSIRAGEIGLSGQIGLEKTMPIFAVDNPTRSTENIIHRGIGVLPIEFGIPLMERILIHLQNNNQNSQFNFEGHHPLIDQGLPIALKNREGVTLGNFLISAPRFTFSAAGNQWELQCRPMATTSRTLQQIGSHRNSIVKNTSKTFTFPILCFTDTVLTMATRPVANITVEARHVEIPALGWTNLETTDIDLSPWDGLTENFEFRLTAGSTPGFVEFTTDVDDTD